jgi:uncharacterized protein GlcG (DUF336 family)
MTAAIVSDTWLDHTTNVMCQKLWPGGWEISVGLPHINNAGKATAQALRWLIGLAVVDDFGNLVMVGVQQ